VSFFKLYHATGNWQFGASLLHAFLMSFKIGIFYMLAVIFALLLCTLTSAVSEMRSGKRSRSVLLWQMSSTSR